LNGNELFSGTASTLDGSITSETGGIENSLGVAPAVVTFSVPDDFLPSGTYWLALSNGQSEPFPATVNWDQSDGPSYFWNNSAGYAISGPCNGLCTHSESFQVIGDVVLNRRR
jgi:hypothetical protein